MRTIPQLILYCLALVGFAGCTQETVGPGSSDSEAVAQLMDDIWASAINKSSYLRLQRGLPIFEVEDFTLERHRSDLKESAHNRELLSSINPGNLDEEALVNYQILAFELEDRGVNDDDFWLTFDITAYQSPYSVRFVQQALAAKKFRETNDTKYYLNLVDELGDMLDQLHKKVEGQKERGIYLPKPALESTRATWIGIAATLPDSLRPAPERLEELEDESRDEFLASLETLVSSRIEPGVNTLATMLDEDYEAAAPVTVGLAQYPGGREVYRRLIARQTTLSLSEQEIHERGVAAVADISARMQAIRDDLGFEGTAREFIDEIQFNPEFIAKSPEEVEARYLEYIGRLEPHLGDYFNRIPEAAYGVRRLPLAAEFGMTYGNYELPTANDPVGYYNYNASGLERRSLIWAASLIYHELLPGHHFHLAMARENESLHPMRQFYSVTAFTEGWAEYAASLAIEMGAYQSPLELYGRYLAEMFLASRLVVDTGLNALGWSLEEARNYMAERVVQSQAEIDSETLRYSTNIPAQALGYRLGYEHIWALRRTAEEALGDSFDIKGFHGQVLEEGTTPLPVLEAKVKRWIEAQGAH